MPIPDYQSLLLPLLEGLGDGHPHPVGPLREQIALRYKLTDAERVELLPSGKQPIFDNRLGWAKTYLDKAGLLRTLARGVYVITTEGQSVLAAKPKRLDTAFLARFPGFTEFFGRKGAVDTDSSDESDTSPAATPREALESAFQQLRGSLKSEVLAAVRGASPEFFERLVVELLVKMGYSGTLQDAGKAVGRSGDGGIDGIIKKDPLGLDAIYVQAKRWENTVGRPDVQAFSGSLDGVRARKGVFITTSTFSAEAKQHVANIDKKIVLMDGDQLAALMIDHELGVNLTDTYQIKRVDMDYFSEE